MARPGENRPDVDPAAPPRAAPAQSTYHRKHPRSVTGPSKVAPAVVAVARIEEGTAPKPWPCGPLARIPREPDVLTPALEERLYELHKSGDTRNATALRAGILYKTLENWMVKGLTIGAQDPHRRFAIRMLQIEAEIRAHLLSDLRYATSSVEAQAIMFILDRRYREWRQPRDNVAPQRDFQVEQDGSGLDAEMVAELLKEIARNPPDQVRKTLEAEGWTKLRTPLLDVEGDET